LQVTNYQVLDTPVLPMAPAAATISLAVKQEGLIEILIVVNSSWRPGALAVKELREC
jgi:hypothetical protein